MPIAHPSHNTMEMRRMGITTEEATRRTLGKLERPYSGLVLATTVTVETSRCVCGQRQRETLAPMADREHRRGPLRATAQMTEARHNGPTAPSLRILPGNHHDQQYATAPIKLALSAV